MREHFMTMTVDLRNPKVMVFGLYDRLKTGVYHVDYRYYRVDHNPPTLIMTREAVKEIAHV